MAAAISTKHQSPLPLAGIFAKLGQIALVIALATVVARCTMLPPESIREPFATMPGTEAYPLGANAVTSLMLDLLCCVPAILVLFRRMLDRQYALTLSWSQLILLPLLGWMALSVRWADDKFTSVISVSNVIAAFALFWAACHLVRDWLQLRIVASATFGLLLIILAQGFYYRFVEVPETKEFYQQHKKEFLQQRGWKEDDFNAIQYEKKLMSGELMVFNTSPNSFAAIITLLMIIAISLALQRIADHDSPGWAVGILLAFPLSIWLLRYTYSKAAIAAPLLAVILLAVVFQLREQLTEKSRKFYWIGVAAAVGIILAVVGLGLVHHSLPTASLNFRWRYWIASARIFRAHPLLGVGWDNFGLYYIRYRLPIASEEIRDPHNFIVRFFVELGAVGGVLLLLWLLRIWWEITRPISPPVPIPIVRRAKFQSPASRLPFIVWLPVIAFVINVLFGVDFSQTASYLLVVFTVRLLWLCALGIGLFLASLKSIEPPQMDDRPAPWILYGILIAVGVFLIHNLIEFSLFEPGTMCLFALLIGAALGVRNPAPSPRRATAIAGSALALAIFGLLTFTFLLVIPIAQGESDARAGDEALRKGQFKDAEQWYESAGQRVPFNADYILRAASVYFTQAQYAGSTKIPPPPDWENVSKPLLKLAAQRNPSDVATFLTEARIGDMHRDASAIIAGYEKALQLNPNEVSIHLEYAHALGVLGRTSEQRQQLQIALDYNDQLDRDEPKRLNENQVSQIKSQIAGLK